MAGWKDRLALAAQRNRQGIIKAELNRREMIRMGLITTSGTFVLKQGLTLADDGRRLGFVESCANPRGAYRRDLRRRCADASLDHESGSGQSDDNCRRSTADSRGTRLSFA